MADRVRTPEVADCDLLVVGGGAAGLAGAVTAAHHGLGRDRRREGAGARRRHGVVGRLDVGAAEPALAGRRDRRGHRRPAHLPQARARASTTTSRGWTRCWRTAGTWSRSSRTHTALQFVSGSWIADIQGDLPGAGTGGRSVGPRSRSTPGGCARTCARRLRPQLYETSFLGHGHHGRPGPAGLPARHHLGARRSCTPAWRVAFHLLDLVTHRRGMQLVNGPALIARLVKSADDARGAAVGRLASDPADHRRRPGDRSGAGDARTVTVTVRARRGVLLAAGGFPHDVGAPRASCSRAPRPGGSTGRSRRRRPPATGSSLGRVGRRPARHRRWPHRRPGARCRWCRTAAAGSASTRTSSTAASPA